MLEGDLSDIKEKLSLNQQQLAKQQEVEHAYQELREEYANHQEKYQQVTETYLSLKDSFIKLQEENHGYEQILKDKSHELTVLNQELESLRTSNQELKEQLKEKDVRLKELEQSQHVVQEKVSVKTQTSESTSNREPLDRLMKVVEVLYRKNQKLEQVLKQVIATQIQDRNDFNDELAALKETHKKSAEAKESYTLDNVEDDLQKLKILSDEVKRIKNQNQSIDPLSSLLEELKGL